MAFQQLSRWKDSSATVRVSLIGRPLSQSRPSSFRANLDGVIAVFDEGSKTLAISASGGNQIEMHLDECVFNDVPFGSPDPADSAELEAVLQIDLPTGEVCVLMVCRILN